uniref:TROVE domain-containing protein n=1 Tax=Timspurckia oligopyrenoides TaxID=708627 RepID=A0A7S1EUB9_9RHOD|mmetsp:Transcript_8363/g.15132  ORF Transcript_8363/g.15132 Transcript_8363/m.15132 type:complete len:496 (+) Transcript_8363:96-1583(+)|eukprot:CAMPEP_0182446752 /NCGR_PEP_ID=MMETSP1172-20130603/5648_1 /TAXON_ID=708627 /ORGANISM="Timspurckia oligopyrenoides, Strain CCMP3278" /LENGTH=495 /DNA_ID=CAMNT_0024642791 /DNA_START=51 /DNA_END=1538 /DNA_ORIENTATION=+
MSGNSFVDSIKSEPDTETLNGMKAYSSTLDANLDLFFQCIRSVDDQHLLRLINCAWGEDALSCLKVMFNARDCRKDSVGKGDRRPFHIFLDWLLIHSPKTVIYNLHVVVQLGYWKDIIVLADRSNFEPVIDFIVEQIKIDKSELDAADSEHRVAKVSLLGKYLPGENKSRDGLAQKIRRKLNYSNAEYRQLKSKLGACVMVVEQKMSENEWDDIEYSLVPSIAMNRYRKAFMRHSEVRFQEYLDSVKRGETKINAGQVFPHDLVKEYFGVSKLDETIERQWDELQRSCASLADTLVMSDVSGSMSSGFGNVVPMHVSVALGLLCSAAAPEPWKNLVLTFSSKPKFHRIPEGSLYARVQSLLGADWGMSTNLEAAFDLILKKAVDHRAAQSEMPKRLMIISDMQFNQATSGRDTSFKMAQKKYRQAGYDFPQVVYWNVNGTKSLNFPVSKDQSGALLLSGYSPNIMRSLVETGEVTNPMELLQSILSHPRYAQLRV